MVRQQQLVVDTIRIRATNSEGSNDWTLAYTITLAPVVTGVERGLYTLTPESAGFPAFRILPRFYGDISYYKFSKLSYRETVAKSGIVLQSAHEWTETVLTDQSTQTIDGSGS